MSVFVFCWAVPRSPWHLQHVLDVLQAGMDLRVLHAIAHGQTWYGRWSYLFGRGMFNVPQTRWEMAVRKLHKASLTALWPFMMESGHSGTPLAAILRRYTGSSKEVRCWLVADKQMQRQAVGRGGGHARTESQFDIAGGFEEATPY